MKLLRILFFFIVLGSLYTNSRAQSPSVPNSIEQPCYTPWSEAYTDTLQILIRKVAVPITYTWHARISCPDTIRPIYYDYYISSYTLLLPDKTVIAPRELEAIAIEHFLYRNLAEFPTDLDTTKVAFRLIVDECVERQFTVKANVSNVSGCGNESFDIINYSFQPNGDILYQPPILNSKQSIPCPSGCVQRYR